MAEAKFIVRRALSNNAPLTLNADDPESVRFSEQVQQRIIWFGLNPQQGWFRTYLQNNGDAAFLDGNDLVLLAFTQRDEVLALIRYFIAPD